jgi:uncharacterized protein YbaR (Trm112 family)
MINPEINPELLEILRCPLSPNRSARLLLQDGRLSCERCALGFKIKDGFPILVVEEAELPPGCESQAQLPCQKEEAKQGSAASPTGK